MIFFCVWFNIDRYFVGVVHTFTKRLGTAERLAGLILKSNNQEHDRGEDLPFSFSDKTPISQLENHIVSQSPCLA